MSNNPEQLRDNQENNIEVGKSAAERLEKLGSNQESKVELSPRDAEAKAEKARAQALETAISVESGGKEKAKSKASSGSPRRGQINKKQREKSFTNTMKRVQGELPVGRRAFSKVIHNKVVEKTSDVIGGTVARPNAILIGSIFAFALTLLAYTVAKTIGYRLSGFETIAAFILGWVVGIIYDYLRLLVTGKKS